MAASSRPRLPQIRQPIFGRRCWSRLLDGRLTRGCLEELAKKDALFGGVCHRQFLGPNA